MQAKAKQIGSKTSKAAAKQALAAAEQQLVAGRARRATLMQQLAMQCQRADAAGEGCSLDQVMQLCAAMPAASSDSSSEQQWLQEAAVVCAAAGSGPPASLDGDGDAVSCLRTLLVHFGCSSIPDLLAAVGASLQAAASLRAALTGALTTDAAPAEC